MQSPFTMPNAMLRLPGASLMCSPCGPPLQYPPDGSLPDDASFCVVSPCVSMCGPPLHMPDDALPDNASFGVVSPCAPNLAPNLPVASLPCIASIGANSHKFVQIFEFANPMQSPFTMPNAMARLPGASLMCSPCASFGFVSPCAPNLPGASPCDVASIDVPPCNANAHWHAAS